MYFRATSDMCSYITSPNVLFTCCLWSCERAGQGYFKGEFHSQAWLVWWIVSNGCFFFCQISNFISHNLRKRHIKALVNEDTLLRTHCCPWCFLSCANWETFCCGHKMFLNKIRNLFCVPDTKFLSATNVARAGKRGNICVKSRSSHESNWLNWARLMWSTAFDPGPSSLEK